ncbi:MAG: hypothetical protein WCA11_00575 [Terracidiphilus sp.]
MNTKSGADLLIADRIWIATALLHQQFCLRNDFKKEEIRQKIDEEGLGEGIERSTLSAHLDQHCVANVPPSSGKYRMLYEATPGGNLRLFRPGDLTHPARVQSRKPSKIVPRREEIPHKYWPLLDWYETWSKQSARADSPINWEDDPLIRLIGSGKHIWADEHADEYVNRLREESA